MDEFLGRYYVFKTRTRVEIREYILTIFDLTGFKADFLLELIISGTFGSVGIEWTGKCYLKEERLYLECQTKNDWDFTFLHDEREENITKFSKMFTGFFTKERNNVRLDLSFEVNKIFLYKILNDGPEVSYRTTQDIITKHVLDEKVKEYDPHRFWCITNLVYTDFKEIDTNKIELTYEFDIEYRLEEKRVINADEIISEHYKNNVIVNNEYKLLN